MYFIVFVINETEQIYFSKKLLKYYFSVTYVSVISYVIDCYLFVL